MIALHVLLCGSAVAATSFEVGYWVGMPGTVFFQVAQALGLHDYDAIKDLNHLTNIHYVEPERLYTVPYKGFLVSPATWRVSESSAFLELNTEPAITALTDPTPTSP